MTHAERPGKLAILWVSDDPGAARNMVFMYAGNAPKNDWWSQVTLIVWGPSARLLAEDPELRDECTALAEDGVELLACKACADRYGVSDDLTAAGFDVLYMGAPLTDMLKDPQWAVLSI